MKMKINKMNSSITTLLMILSFGLFIISCSKQDAELEKNIAYKMLSEKNWYLEYAKTTTNDSTVTKTYIGQPTYFINFLNNKTTKDSDGFSGTYSIIKNGDSLKLLIITNSSNGNPNNYNYDVISLGEKHMILAFTKNNSRLTYYYNTTRQ